MTSPRSRSGDLPTISRTSRLPSDPVLQVQASLTERDHLLLFWLADHGLLTSDQIANALYPSLDYAQRRLRRLTALGVIGRFRPQKPDGGSYPYHYVLDQLGVDVVAAQRGEEPPRRTQARDRRRHLTSRANLPHLLGVNQFFTDLSGYARTHPEAEAHLERWWPASRCQQMGALAHSEQFSPETWGYIPSIRPDGHGIWAENGQRVFFFLEYDTGTESLPRLVDKLTGYRALERKLRHTNGWPVLFWLHSSARERNLHHLLTQIKPAVPVATGARDFAHLTGRTPAEAVWHLHGHSEGPLRLADLQSQRP
jgi:predicted transcriptional regulator